MITRRRALAIAAVAVRHGVRRYMAVRIAFAARELGLGPALAFALVEQESLFKNIFGCDAGSILCHEQVTKARYRQLQAHVRNGGVSNGVGPTQVTYSGFILGAPGLWKPRANIYFGLGLLKSEINLAGEVRVALARYNGGPNPPTSSWQYASEVLNRRAKWQRRFD